MRRVPKVLVADDIRDVADKIYSRDLYGQD